MNKKRVRKINTRLIRQSYPYHVDDIVDLYGIHKQTVYQWIKAGLPTTDSQKPFIIRGVALREFIDKRQLKRKITCKENELYCCKCRCSRQSWENAVDIFIENEKQINIQGLCEVCNTTTNRWGRTAKLEIYQKLYNIQTVHDKRLTGCTLSAVNTHLEGGNQT